MNNQFSGDYDNNKLVMMKYENLKFYVAPRYVGFYENEDYEKFSIDIFKYLIKPDSTVLDIGSHYGFYSLVAANIAEKGKVYSFEPVIENYMVIKKNVDLNSFKNVKILNNIVSNKNLKMPFMVSEASDSSGITANPNAGTKEVRKLESITVDKALRGNKVDVVKIDVEGHELSVLEGMRETIKNNKNIVLITEFNPKCIKKAGYKVDEFLQTIQSLGFNIHLILEKERKLVKIKDLSSWKKYIPKESYCNVICLRKNKINFVSIVSHSSVMDGAERSLLDMSKQLLKKGYLLNIVVPGGGPLLERLRELPVSITNLGKIPWWGANSRDMIDEEGIAQATVEMVNNYLEIKPDLVISNSSVINEGAIAASQLGIPHIWFVRELGKEHDLVFLDDFKTKSKFIDSHSVIVLYNSDFIKKEYSKYISDDKGIVIKNFVSVDFDKSNIKHDDTTLSILLPSRIQPGKGQIDAVKAISTLVNKNKISNVKLTILGSPVDEKYYKKIKTIIKEDKLQDYIDIKPTTQNPYPDFISNDIVLMCSKHEALGRVTIEAMLLKKPVIGTASGGTLEIVKDGLNGFLYEVGDYNSLAGKILKFFNNPKLVKIMGKKAYNFINRDFNPVKNANILDKTLQSIVTVSKNYEIELMGSLINERNTLHQELVARDKLINDIITSKRWVISTKLVETISRIYGKNNKK